MRSSVLLAWLNLGKLRRADRFGAWLAEIALRVCHSCAGVVRRRRGG